MTDRGHRPLNRRELGGLVLAALFGMAAPAAANTAAENYVTGIAEDVMALANTGQKGPALRVQVRRADEPLHQPQGHRGLCAGALQEEASGRRSARNSTNS